MRLVAGALRCSPVQSQKVIAFLLHTCVIYRSTPLGPLSPHAMISDVEMESFSHQKFAKLDFRLWTQTTFYRDFGSRLPPGGETPRKAKCSVFYRDFGARLPPGGETPRTVNVVYFTGILVRAPKFTNKCSVFYRDFGARPYIY